MTLTDILIWGGALVTLAGLTLLLSCITRVARAKRAGLSDEDLQATLQPIIPRNLGGLCLSAMGLILIVVGIVLR